MHCHRNASLTVTTVDDEPQLPNQEIDSHPGVLLDEALALIKAGLRRDPCDCSVVSKRGALLDARLYDLIYSRYLNVPFHPLKTGARRSARPKDR
jgi:hypothetical protein